MSGDDAGIQIRIATADDVQPIAAVLRSAFLEYERCYTSEGFAATTPSEEQIYQRLSEGPVWVALQGERIVGTVSAIAIPESALDALLLGLVALAFGLSRRRLDAV